MLNIRLSKLIFLLVASLFLLSNQAQAESNQPQQNQASTKQTQVLFISAAHSNKAKVSLLKEAAKKHSVKWQITHKSTRELTDIKQVEQLFNQHQLVVLDGVSKNESEKSYQAYLGLIAKTNSVFFTPSWLSEPASQKGINQKQQNTLRDYWKNGGRANLTNMLSYISADVFGDKAVDASKINNPIIFPDKGIYHPQQPNLTVNNLDDYIAWKAPKADQPKIALLFQRANIEVEQTTLIDETIKRFEDKGVFVVPFFFKLSAGEKNYNQLLYLAKDLNEGKVNPHASPSVDLIINFRNIHWANQRKLEFEQFGVPVLQALTYYSGNKDAWEADPQGISAGMMAFTLVLPETAGVTDPMVVAAMDRRTAKVEVIDYQLEHLVNKAVNLTKLKYKANKDKKLTMFVWGDQDVGASFMNVPESVASITQTLIDQGYVLAPRDADDFTNSINKILDPFYRDYQLNELLAEDLAELMPISEYLNWFNTLPAALQSQVNQHWGQPQDNFMAVNRDGTDYFVLPRYRNGNMLVMRQPPRSDNKNDESGMFHNGIAPINHFYLAVYYYARSYWNSDAIIHLGTHGSQEWLGGKERGLSMFDQGNLAVWDTPIVYPFIVDDVGEAMQTKRRGRATTISHMTPPFSAAGLHGEIAILDELMHQYKSLDEGGVKDKTAKQIAEKCITEKLCTDIGWEQEAINADFPVFFEELHEYMHTLARANQPLGLHTFGELSEQKLLTSTVIQMLGKDFVKYTSEFERAHYKLGDKEAEPDHQEKEHAHTEPAAHSYYYSDKNDANDVKKEAKDVDKLVGYTTALNYIVKPIMNADDINQPLPLQELEPELIELIEKGKKQFIGISNIRELTSMTDFLAGKYIPVKNGGDPIRHPNAVPTGYNLIGFDPSKVPTKAAYEQGKELIDQLVADHHNKHGQYPDKLAFSLWSIETMRHYGVLEAQAMYAMGVKPTWTPSGRVTGTEIIPYSELKRPRIDVVLSATGLYRDAFPSVMQMLAKAVKDVAKLKEESNPIWRNSVRVKQELLAEGVSEDDAEYLSTVRVFSNQSGDYGSGTDELAWASDKWDDDKVIAENYMNKMGYYFGADSSRWGKKITDSQGKSINLYGKQLSGTDVALFSRSSNLYGMITSDDPFEYFGSIALAVRALDGKSPEMRISNLRDTQNIKSQDAASFMSTELRTRNFHPRWIKEMQKEGYSGAVTMSSNLDNFFGWQVVDPNIVRSDQWDAFFDVYVDDKLELGLDEWFEKTNPEALARMMQRMLEAERKQYWDASPERLQKLVETYSEFVEKYNLFVDNQKLKENVTELAKGFGLTPPSFSADSAKVDAEMNPQQSAQGQTEQVSGQKLEQQQPSESPEIDNTVWFSILGLLVIFMAGFGLEWSKYIRSKV